jgi:isoquinoline 1-oxidoreductase
MAEMVLLVNGRQSRVEAPAEETLLSVLRNQIAGAIVQAIGGAMFEAVRFEKGRILNPHFSQYRVPRFADLPQIEVVMLDRRDLPPAGAGETPIVGLAPAVANAVFAATGKRLRAMPLLVGGKIPG